MLSYAQRQRAELSARAPRDLYHESVSLEKGVITRGVAQRQIESRRSIHSWQGVLGQFRDELVRVPTAFTHEGRQVVDEDERAAAVIGRLGTLQIVTIHTTPYRHGNEEVEREVIAAQLCPASPDVLGTPVDLAASYLEPLSLHGARTRFSRFLDTL